MGKNVTCLPAATTHNALGARPSAFNGMSAAEIGQQLRDTAIEVVNKHLEEESLDAAKFVLGRMMPQEVHHKHSGQVETVIRWAKKTDE